MCRRIRPTNKIWGRKVHWWVIFRLETPNALQLWDPCYCWLVLFREGEGEGVVDSIQNSPAELHGCVFLTTTNIHTLKSGSPALCLCFILPRQSFNLDVFQPWSSSLTSSMNLKRNTLFSLGASSYTSGSETSRGFPPTFPIPQYV